MDLGLLSSLQQCWSRNNDANPIQNRYSTPWLAPEWNQCELYKS
jgi:hypothetical protein